MTEALQNQERTRFSLWMQAIRPFSYTAVIAPTLIGAMGALAFFHGKIDWILLPFIMIGAILLQVGGNLMSEYHDFILKVDRKETYGSSRILVDELLAPRTILRAANLSFILGVLFGLVTVFYRADFILLWLGLVGLVCGYMYGARPLRLKYIALGDLAIFLSFGPLMVFGSYYALCGDFNSNLFAIALPISFLVIAILHANNTRDIKHDGEAKIKTMALLLGVKGSIYYYDALVIGSYIATIAMIAFKILPIWSLLVLLSLPPAIKNIKTMHKAEFEKPQEISMLDVFTAQHHLLFGLLFSIALLLAYIF